MQSNKIGGQSLRPNRHSSARREIDRVSASLPLLEEHLLQELDLVREVRGSRGSPHCVSGVRFASSVSRGTQHRVFERSPHKIFAGLRESLVLLPARIEEELQFGNRLCPQFALLLP